MSESRLWKRQYNDIDPRENWIQGRFPGVANRSSSSEGLNSTFAIGGTPGNIYKGLDRLSSIENFRIVVMRRWKRELDPMLRAEVFKVSRTFARDMVIVEKKDEAKWGLSWHIPYYFAKYVHDGRGPVRAKPGKVLIFMDNPNHRRLDPRWGNGYPNEKSDAISFKDIGWDMKQVKEAKPPFRIAKAVGPAEAQPFFTRAQPAVVAKAQFILVETARTFWVDTLNKMVDDFNQFTQVAMWQQTSQMGLGRVSVGGL